MTAPRVVVDFSAGAGELAPIRAAFGEPCRELFAWDAAEVESVLAEVDALAHQGFWCVGYLRYEAATAFEPRAAVHPADGPLAYFSIHRETIEFPAMQAQVREPLAWSRPLGREAFDGGMARIHQAIADGEVYQINYTSPLQAPCGGDTFELFCALRRAQPNALAAYVANGHEHVLSVSPELFFDWDGHTLRCEPMKGTAPRGRTPQEDRAHAAALAASPKERAENVMIVDLVRNDLSRVAQPGSVRVPRLFECQSWPTVWQMTSTVLADTKPQVRLADVFRALFPCGSVTGAPKLRAMHWIRELEPAGRGVYCGAVGVVMPGGAARFNVPIRTVTVRGEQASCGVGSGITWDATADAEWAEWHHKAAFLESASQPFDLLQTVRFEGGAWHALELHLDRLEAAASHFGFAFDRAAARATMDRAVESLRGARVRVTVAPDGRVQVGVAALPPRSDAILPVRLADAAIEAPMAFLRHKTTRRGHYEAFEPQPPTFDTLLWNSAGEVTEFTRGNVIIERADGELVTPPLHCGLLDGVGRAQALGSGQVKEAVVRIEELASARKVWFVNSLRGQLRVDLRLDAPATAGNA